MGKATLRSAVLLALLAMGMAVTAMPSFAETQNVKVGGDVTTRAFWRKNLDLNKGNATLNDDRFIQLTTGLNVTADLTDNVTAGIRLANETTYGRKDSAVSDFAVSQSWVKLKDLFFSPLTVTFGRQPIVWGRGFVLGSNLIPGILGAPAGDLHSSISADEFTVFTAFDAARATLDFQGAAAVNLPLTVDMVYIKLQENTVGVADDVNLMGVNFGTKIEAGNSEMEAYYLNKRDNSVVPTTGIAPGNKRGSVNTIGVRGSTAPVEGSYLYGELAYQFGKDAADPFGVRRQGEDHQAWAFDIGADYTAKSVPWTPKLGAEWIYFSGRDVDGAVPGWDPIARGYFTTALREFQNPASFYPSTQTCRASGASGGSCLGSATNQSQFSVYGSVKPLEDLTIAPRLSWFFLPVGVLPDAGTAGTQLKSRKRFAGTEWDTVVTYNYTPDVQFGVIYGVFAPGTVYRNGNNEVAQELVSTVGVKF